MFHDFAYRLQESVPNKSVSNEFVRKRALSFLYGIQKAIWITEIRLFTSLSHFPSILYGQSRRIIVSHYAVPTEWQRFSLKCCHSFLLSISQIKCTCYLGQKVQSGEIDASRATVIEDTGIGWGANHIWASRNITSPEFCTEKRGCCTGNRPCAAAPYGM